MFAPASSSSLRAPRPLLALLAPPPHLRLVILARDRPEEQRRRRSVLCRQRLVATEQRKAEHHGDGLPRRRHRHRRDGAEVLHEQRVQPRAHVEHHAAHEQQRERPGEPRKVSESLEDLSGDHQKRENEARADAVDVEHVLVDARAVVPHARVRYVALRRGQSQAYKRQDESHGVVGFAVGLGFSEAEHHRGGGEEARRGVVVRRVGPPQPRDADDHDRHQLDGLEHRPGDVVDVLVRELTQAGVQRKARGADRVEPEGRRAGLQPPPLHVAPSRRWTARRPGRRECAVAAEGCELRRGAKADGDVADDAEHRELEEGHREEEVVVGKRL